MSRETLIAGHERKQALLNSGTVVQLFIKDAFKEGAHKIKPKHTSQDHWFRQIMIGVVYNDIGSTAILDELADKYGTFRQSIAESNKNFLRNLWNNSPPSIQERYPLNEILTARKPLSQKLREKHSEAHGGTSLRIKRAIENIGITVVGIENIGDIARDARVTQQKLFQSRPVLANWGIDIPRLKTYADFAEKISKENDDKKLQEFLDSQSDNLLRGFLARNPSHEILATLSVIARKKGFWFHARQVRFIAEKIKTAGIPVRQIERLDKNGKLLGSYYVVCTKHSERIAEVLKNDPDMQRFR